MCLVSKRVKGFLEDVAFKPCSHSGIGEESSEGCRTGQHFLH